MEHIKAEIELFRQAAKQLLSALPEDVVLMARLAEIELNASRDRITCYLFFIPTYNRIGLTYNGKNYPYVVGIQPHLFLDLETVYTVRTAERWGYRETITASPNDVASMIRQAGWEL